MDIAIELSYDSASDSYDYMQAKRCEYDGYFDYYSVSIASDVEYDGATESWDGDYKAYITIQRMALQACLCIIWILSLLPLVMLMMA